MSASVLFFKAHIQRLKAQMRLCACLFLFHSIFDRLAESLMDAIHAHAHFDDLDLDAGSQWVGNGKTISVDCSRQLSKQ